MKTVAIVLGTRPEVIKLAPVVHALSHVHLTVIDTGQHAISDIARSVGLHLDYRSEGGLPTFMSLPHRLAVLLTRIEALLSQPSLVIVQGDTLSALAGALTAFHRKIPIAHVEAGLRTWRANPFPEEMTRRLIAHMATLHFCPTERAMRNLNAENADLTHAYITGNTGIDALLLALDGALGSFIDHRSDQPVDSAQRTGISPHRTTPVDVLVTCHRREDIDARLTMLITHLNALAGENPDVTIHWPVHMNPRVAKYVRANALPVDNLIISDPLDYHAMLRLLVRARVVVTDSGGVIEEATALRRKVVIIRDETERPEALDRGAVLVPLSRMETLTDVIQSALSAAPATSTEDTSLSSLSIDDVFGDGHAAERIAKHILNYLEIIA